MATGRLTILTDSIVSEVLYDKDKARATGVRIIDANSMQTSEYFAHLIFVNASTVGTAFILMNSTSDRFPNGLGNDSGTLGHYLMDHHFRCGASGEAPSFDNKYTYGRRANGIYVPRYRNVDKREKRDYVARVRLPGTRLPQRVAPRGRRAGDRKGFQGHAHHAGNVGHGPRRLRRMPALSREYRYAGQDQKDKWGLPTVVFDTGFKENEHAMRKDMIQDAAEMLEAAGIKNIKTFDSGSAPGQAIHEMGTARMGNDPKDSMLNKWNQMHAIKNVFITDGSFMCSTACQNPSLTFMAMTARACDYAVKEMKKMNI